MSKLNILIVEDEALVAEVVKIILTRLGYYVLDIASSGREAILKAEEKRPHLILMDINLEGDMDGIEAAEKIFSMFDIPLIFMTANADHGTRKRADRIRHSGYLNKPFGDKQLKNALARASA